MNASATNLVLKLARSTGEETGWAQGMANGSTVRLMGTVVDDQSGQPIPSFRVRLDEHRGTAKSLVGEGHDGRFDWPVFMTSYREFSLEVDADDYAPTLTDTRPVQAGIQTFQIRLLPGATLAGQVVAPSGQPVADAFVGFNGEGFGCMLLEGGSPNSGNDAPQTTTDSHGRFSFKPRVGVESVLIAHDLGCALVALGALGKDPIVLQPWGAIEGTLLVGGQPAAGQGVTLGTAAAMEPEGTLTINAQANTTTDANGRFRFPKVPAGPLVVCRYFNFNRDKIGPVGMSHYQEVIVPAGGIADVPPGEYMLQLTVAEPFDPDAYDPAGNPIMRRTLGNASRPVSVSASAAGEPQDLGTITVPLD